MKKKIMALLLSLAFSLAIGTSAMAAGSPYIVYPVIEELAGGGLNRAESKTMNALFEPWLGDDGRFTASVWDGSERAVQLNDAAVNMVKLYSGITGYGRADIIAFMNITAMNVSQEMWNAGVPISLMDVPDAGYTQYVVFHVRSDGALEVIPNRIESGRIVGTFHSLSPVIVVGLGQLPTTTTAVDSNGAAVELVVDANPLAGANSHETQAYGELFRTWQEGGRNDLDGLSQQLAAGSITEAQYRERRSEVLTRCFKENVSRHSQVEFDTIEWYGEANISLTNGGAIPDGGWLDVTIYDQQIKRGSTMILLHIKDDGTVEEIRDLRVAEGSITGRFRSLSPVVYFEVAVKEGSVNQGGARPGTGNQTGASGAQGSGSTAQAASSPKTGEQGTAAPFCLAGMTAACGAVYLGRRRLRS